MFKNVPVEKENKLSRVGVNDIRRKLYMVGTYTTVEKRAKRMPDNKVELSHVTINL